MRLDREGDRFTIDARDLGELLKLEPDAVRELMRAREISTLCERGEGEDAGRFRLTFTHEARRVRLIVTEAGEVVQRSRTRIKPRA